MSRNRKRKTVRIFTKAYRPFMMGGDVHRPIATEVEAEGPFNIGKGFSAWISYTPKGTPIIIENKTGGIVGNSLESPKMPSRLD